MKLSGLLELGGIVGVHAATSKVLSQAWGRRCLGGSEEDIRKRRAVICAAVALLVMGSRWQVKNKGLFVAALVVKLLNFFEDADSSCKTAVCSVFFPIAAVMWTKWPLSAAGIETIVHPEFISTMGNLVGIGSKAGVQAFARNPSVPSISQLASNAIRGAQWGFKALFTVYVIQALIGWASRKEKSREDLFNRIKKAFSKALRTQIIYTGCATWSNVAYGYLGNKPPLLGAGPVLLFVFEPMNRLRTITEYYIAHFIYCYYQQLRHLLVQSKNPALVSFSRSANSTILSLGLPAAMLMFNVLKIDPPFLGALKSITL